MHSLLKFNPVIKNFYRAQSQEKEDYVLQEMIQNINKKIKKDYKT